MPTKTIKKETTMNREEYIKKLITTQLELIALSAKVPHVLIALDHPEIDVVSFNDFLVCNIDWCEIEACVIFNDVTTRKAFSTRIIDIEMTPAAIDSVRFSEHAMHIAVRRSNDTSKVVTAPFNSIISIDSLVPYDDRLIDALSNDYLTHISCRLVPTVTVNGNFFDHDTDNIADLQDIVGVHKRPELKLVKT